MRVSDGRYIYPPRPKSSIPREELDYFSGWTAQLKYNDTRAIMLSHSDSTELWSRHKSKLNYQPGSELQREFREIRAALGLSGYCILDGGLLNDKHEAIKDTIVIWDILVLDSEYLVGTTYQHRWELLERAGSGCYQYDNRDFGVRLTDNIFIPIASNETSHLWDLVDTVNEPFLKRGKGPLLEGVILKDPDGILEFASRPDNNDSWQVRSRVATGRHRF